MLKSCLKWYIILCNWKRVWETQVTLTDIYGRLAYTALFYTIFMALWGLWRYFRKQSVDGSYLGAMVVAELVYIAPMALGVYLHFIAGGLPGGGMHILYGTAAALVIPVMFFFTRGAETRQMQLMYGAGFLLVVGILLRSFAAGG